MKASMAKSIRRISVTDLFGMYDYNLSLDKAAEPSNILILYGDNGSGKSTLLKLAFHLLAPEDRQGHKSNAAPIPFRRFEIEFSDRSRIRAFRPEGKLTGSFSMEIYQGRKKRKTIEFVADEQNSVKAVSQEHDAQIQGFLNALRDFKVSLYMLADDRTINVAGRDRRAAFPFDMGLEEEWVFFDTESRAKIRRPPRMALEKIAQVLLFQSLRRAEAWIRRKAMHSSSVGESSVNTLYTEILRRIVNLPQSESIDSASTKKSIENRVRALEKQCQKFAQYGLLPKFSGKEIMTAVSSAPGTHLGIITNVLTPYLESLEKKLEAMAEIHRRIDTFVSIINRFLTNKKLIFDIHSGITIMTEDGAALVPEMLSSGERHLLLLFCNSLLAVDRPSILMIDEPEISLNIKWQRMLLSSLLECVGDSPVQYIFSTHSMELLAQHRNYVIKLTNLKVI